MQNLPFDVESKAGFVFILNDKSESMTRSEKRRLINIPAELIAH
jgi:hypothetical protein